MRALLCRIILVAAVLGMGGSRWTPMEAVDYYHLVEKVMSGRERTESFLKLFMVRGMGHCFGGPGPTISGFAVADGGVLYP
jgi:hypothetical protein